MRWKPSLAVISLMLSSVAVAQEDRGQGKDLVDMFAKICLKDGADAVSIARDVDAQGIWRPTEGLPDVYESKGDDVQREWVLSLFGKELELIVSRNAKMKKLGNFCTFRFEANDRFYPYIDSFKASTSEAGLSGVGIDVPHLYRAGGKLKDGRPANAFLMTRSLKRLSKNYTTMSLQF